MADQRREGETASPPELDADDGVRGGGAITLSARTQHVWRALSWRTRAEVAGPKNDYDKVCICGGTLTSIQLYVTDILDENVPEDRSRWSKR